MATPTINTPLRSKQAVAADRIREMAIKLGPGMKLPTALELSRQLGIAVATLDRSLSYLEKRGVINRRQGSGIYVSKRPAQKTIGLVFGLNIFESGISPFYSLLLKHCEHCVDARNERFSVFLGTPALSGTSPESSPIHHDLEDALDNERLDGLMLFAKASGHQEDVLRQRGLPMVAITRHSEWPGVVHHDLTRAVEESIAELTACDCKSIGFMGALPEHAHIFQEAMSRLGLSFSERLVWSPEKKDNPAFAVHEGVSQRVEMGTRWAAEFAALPVESRPHGLICSDDMMTRGACQAFDRLGLKPGRDFAFCTHANIGSVILDEWKDSLIRFAFDPQETIDAMFRCLDAHMAGTPITEHIFIPPHRIPSTAF
jgi:DNA-binding LacI/PurR family transcriptional regulator